MDCKECYFYNDKLMDLGNASSDGCELRYFHKDFGEWKALFNDNHPKECKYFITKKDFYKNYLKDNFKGEKEVPKTEDRKLIEIKYVCEKCGKPVTLCPARPQFYPIVAFVNCSNCDELFTYTYEDVDKITLKIFEDN